MKRIVRTEQEHYDYEDRTCSPCPGTYCPACKGAGVYRVAVLKARTVTTVTTDDEAPAKAPEAAAPEPSTNAARRVGEILEEAFRHGGYLPSERWSYESTPRVIWTSDGTGKISAEYVARLGDKLPHGA